MLSIRINGESLDLEPGTKLQLEVSHPAFNSRELVGTYSYPIKAKLTPKNKRLINHLHRPERIGDLEKGFECELYNGDTFHKKGIFKFKISNGTIEGYILADNSGVANILSKTTLNDLFKDTTFQLGNNASEIKNNIAATWINFPKVPYVFPYVVNYIANSPERDENGVVITPVVSSMNPVYLSAETNSYEMRYGLAEPPTKSAYMQFPFFSLKYVVIECCKLLGYQAKGSWFSDPWLDRILIFNNVALPLIVSTIGTLKITAGDHLPQISIGKFFNALKNSFGIQILLDPETLTADFTPLKEALVSTSVEDFTTKTGHMKDLNSNEYSGLTIKPTFDSDDKMWSDSPPPIDVTGDPRDPIVREYNFNGGGETYELGTGPILMGTFRTDRDRADERTLLLPVVNQSCLIRDPLVAAGDMADETKHKFSLRFFTYYGMQPDSLGYYYPFASSGVTNYNNIRVGEYAMIYEGEFGLFKRWLEPWFEFQKNAKVAVFNMNLNGSEFTKKLLKLPKIILTDEGVKMRCILSRLSYEFPTYASAEMEVYTQSATPSRSAVPVNPPEYIPPVDGSVPVNPIIIYAILEIENHRRYNEGGLFDNRYKISGDIVIRFYSDRAGTKPFIANNLNVKYKMDHVNRINSYMSFSENRQVICNGSKVVLFSNYTFLMAYRYTKYQDYFSLLPSVGYNIITTRSNPSAPNIGPRPRY